MSNRSKTSKARADILWVRLLGDGGYDDCSVRELVWASQYNKGISWFVGERMLPLLRYGELAQH